MLGTDFVRNYPERVRQAAVDKGVTLDLDRLLSLDRERRRLASLVQSLGKKRNVSAREIARLKASGSDFSVPARASERISDKLGEVRVRMRTVSEELRALLLRVPNVPAEDVPRGQGPAANVEVRSGGLTPRFGFRPLPHREIAEKLGIVDFRAGARFVGSNFPILLGDGAKLERALLSLMLDRHASIHGYTEVVVPYLATSRALQGTGHLPKFEGRMYLLARDDLYLIPTAEVPLTNMHRDRIINGAELPLRYVAYSSCFRREAGAYGRAARGLVRVHQFHKVDLVKFTAPETSDAEQESMVQDAEDIVKLLGLSYRVVKLCTGEMSFAAARSYAIQVWAPGQARFLEVATCSTFADFQARRCNIRYRATRGRLRYVHTVNGSAVALPRTVAAILETFQERDGTVRVPVALVPYMGGLPVIRWQGAIAAGPGKGRSR